MKDFYNKLHQVFEQEATKDLYRSKGIVPIQYIDFYAGQDYNDNLFEAHIFPALLVQWQIAYTDNYEAVATLTFKLCYEQLRDLSSLGQNKVEGLKFLDFIDITDSILKTVETPSTGKLHLINESLSIEDTVVDVFTLTYQCSYCGKQKSLQTKGLRGDFERVELTAKLKSRF